MELLESIFDRGDLIAIRGIPRDGYTWAGYSEYVTPGGRLAGGTP